MARTTTSLRAMVENVNRRNRESTCSAETRRGWNSLLETVLMTADVYAGYGYLKSHEVPRGELPGIEEADGTNTFPDESRRFYHLDIHLKGGK